MMRDLGSAVKPVRIIDAKATEHILHRHGMGKMKHIDVDHLWLQDEVKSNRLKILRVKSEHIGMKTLSNKIIRKHATSMVYMDARENSKSGDAMRLWVGKSEQASQSTPHQQKASWETTGHGAANGKTFRFDGQQLAIRRF